MKVSYIILKQKFDESLIYYIKTYINCLSVNNIKLLIFAQNILKFIIKTYYSPTAPGITAASDACAVSSAGDLAPQVLHW